MIGAALIGEREDIGRRVHTVVFNEETGLTAIADFRDETLHVKLDLTQLRRLSVMVHDLLGLIDESISVPRE